MAAKYDKFAAGEAIRTGRRFLSMTQKELACEVGISESHLKQIETGYRKCSLETLTKILDFLSIPMDSIFEFESGRKSIDLQLMAMPEQQRSYLLEIFQTMISSYPAN